MLTIRIVYCQPVALEVESTGTTNLNYDVNIYGITKAGLDYTANLPAFELFDNRFICFNARNGGTAGLLFHEVYSKYSDKVKYGAKIAYDEGDDELVLSTYNNLVNTKSIRIYRTNGAVGILGAPDHSELQNDGYALKVYGYIYASENFTSSDSTLKTNINSLDNEQNKLKNIRSVSYYKKEQLSKTAKSDSVAKKIKEPKLNYGFLAQEVKEIYPNLVKEGDDGLLAINYTQFIPLLVKSYQEQQEEMEVMQSEIETLKKEIAKLNSTKTKSAKNTPVDNFNETNPVAELYDNTPNPFTDETIIKCYLPGTVSAASIKVFNMNGALIKTYPLTGSGEVETVISGAELNAGMYFYSLIVDGAEIATKRMILTK